MSFALLFVAAVVAARVEGAQPMPGAFQLVATHPLSITQPSDLAIDETGKILWTVTNDPAKVYELDLDGRVRKELKYQGQDLEGIAYDARDRTLWVAEERSREIVHLSLDGDLLKRYRLGLPGKKNSGLEGICLDDLGRMFVLNEKEPGLFIELTTTLSISARRALDFAQDYSGLAYGRKAGCFWIVSDQSRMLYRWSPSKGVIAQLPLPFGKAEGVAVDEAAQLIYIVSDSENKLFVYRI